MKPENLDNQHALYYLSCNLCYSLSVLPYWINNVIELCSAESVSLGVRASRGLQELKAKKPALYISLCEQMNNLLGVAKSVDWDADDLENDPRYLDLAEAKKQISQVREELVKFVHESEA